MASSHYWIKLYIEILDDPKIGRFPDWLFRRMIEIFLSAGENGKGGELLPVTQLAWRLRITEDKLLEALRALREVGVVREISAGVWSVTNYAKRQAPIDASDRGRLFRKAYNGQPAGNPPKEETWSARLCKEVPASPGIYKIACTANGMNYVGGSKNLYARLKAHLSEMRSGIHWMSGDWRKFGEDSITVGVLELVDDLAQLAERERYHISQYPSDSLYNGEAGKNNRTWVERETNASFVEAESDPESDPESDSESERKGDIPSYPASPAKPPGDLQTFERIWQQATGMATFLGGSREQDIPRIEAIFARNGRAFERTVAELKRYFDAWCNTISPKTKRKYSRSNSGWLDWVVAGEVPASSNGSKPKKEYDYEALREKAKKEGL